MRETFNYRVKRRREVRNKVTIHLDEIKIYNYALSEGEILADMESPTSSAAVEPGGKLAVAWGTIKANR